MQHTFTRILFITFLLLGQALLFAQRPTSGSALLSGQQVVLPVATAASGTVALDFSPVGSREIQLVVTGSFSGLSSQVATNINGGAHLHIAYPGRSERIESLVLAADLTDDRLGGSFSAERNTFIIDAEDYEGLDLGQLYVDIHTRNYPDGELRGNVVSGTGKEIYYTNLLGSNEVPSVISPAAGALMLTFDPTDNTLVVAGSFDNLTDTLATSINGGVHLHVGLPGRNGPVRFPLTATQEGDLLGGFFEGAQNTFTLTDEQAALLRSGQFYGNIHSGAFPSGEIRGQVLPRADAVFRAHLTGANEWPVVTSGASGQVLGHLSGDTLRVIGAFADLEAPVATNLAGGAHLHPAYAGMNGPILQPLTLDLADDERAGSFALTDNVYELTAEQREQLLERGIYLNIHSTDHLAGEIRGQMLPESQAVFTAFLNGNQQIPSVTTGGRGMVKVELMGRRMVATGSFTALSSNLNTAINGGAHLHAGYPGQAGPVIYPLAVDLADDERAGLFRSGENTFDLTGGRLDTLTDRFFYANIHSLDHPGGEIRGSVLAEAESYFLAPLSGASEPQGVATDATGMLAAEVVDSTVTLVGSFADLDSDYDFTVAGGMHLHGALAGSNGGIVQLVETEVTEDNRSGVILADSNQFFFTDELYRTMRDRGLYANVHTADQPGGAIRGQLLPLAGSYFHTTFSGVNATNFVTTTAQGGLKLELIDSLLTVTGSVTMLEGDFDASVAGGAHLHLAPTGENGPIEIPLAVNPGEDLKSATFRAADTTYVLDPAQLAALRNGQLYANIHTTTVPTGEARGQIRSELNLAPTASSILTPVSGDSLDLAGNSNDTLRVTYSGSTDADGDTVVYVWQLATDENFATLLLAANTGRDTFFTTDYRSLDTLLSSAGVDTGATVTLYHRVLASDGSNHRSSEAATIVLNRGDIVDTRDYLPLGFAGVLYPNPVKAGLKVTYELTVGEAFRGRLSLYSQLGQLLTETTVEASAGTQRYALGTATLGSGQYFVVLRDARGRLVQTARLIAQ